jgi:hypothetical protein
LLGRTIGFLSLPLALLAVLLWPSKPKIPIVDMQMHYNREAWGLYQARAVAAALEELEVLQAAVSSVPNEGTFRLQREAPERIRPFFQPYRTAQDRDAWSDDPDVLALIEREARHWGYAGIGEIHLPEGDLDRPAVRRLLAIAADRDICLSVHSGVEGIHRLFAMAPAARVLWSHAGMTATPGVIAEMLARYPTLAAELSHRTDIAPDGNLDPAWRELFLEYPTRFMVGSGTYTNEFWYQFRYILGRYRDWLEELPPGVAERIAYRNAQELLGAGRPDQQPTASRNGR